MAPSFPSGTNTYVPNAAATGGLLVGFSRNKDEFSINDMVEMFPVKNNTGLYAVYTSRNQGRILSPNDYEHLWGDGEAAPSGVNNLDSFEFKGFITQRRAYPFTIGEMAVDQAAWDILLVESNDVAQQAMTARTMLAYVALAGATWGLNTAPVDGAYSGGILPSGQNWTNGSVGYSGNSGPNLFKTLQYAGKYINLLTMGKVKPNGNRKGGLTLWMNPTTAQGIAASTEVQNLFSQSQFALKQLRGEDESQNGQWGLPDQIRTYKIRVDDTVRVSSKKGATSDTLGYVIPDGEAYLLATPGQLQGLLGTRSYSTLQMFYYKDEMTVETMYDQPNRRYMGRVVSNYQMVTATTYSGFRFVNALG